MKIVSINGKIIHPDKAKISIFSNAFQRGFGIFETLRTYQNKLFLPEKHLDRLLNGCKTIDLKIQKSKEELLIMIENLKNKSPYRNQRIKIIVTQEEIIITSEKLSISPKVYNGVSCKSIRCNRSLPELKSISYLSSYLNHQKAANLGFYDAILMDEKNEIYEGAYSNIFWFEGKILCTRKDKILPGITRKLILEISPFKVKFITVKLQKLVKMKEIFLTQSTTGIVPITKIDKTTIGNGLTGENTQVIMKAFQRYIDTSIKKSFSQGTL